MLKTDVHFVLREPNSIKETPIILIYRFNKNRLKYSTDLKILPRNWDSANQRAKTKGIIKTRDREDSKDINLVLARFIDEMQSINSIIIREKITPTTQFYKNELDKKFLDNGHKIKVKYTLITYMEFFINEMQKGERLQSKKNIPYSPATIKNYKTLLNKLKDFQQVYINRLEFERLNIHFYKEFIKYLTNQNYKLNSIGNSVKVLKVILKQANKEQISDNKLYENEDFSKPSEESSNIYLTDSELNLIYNYDLSCNPTLDKVRDFFLIGCYTGLRKSDLNQLKPENFINEGKMIKIRTIKTKDWIHIPLNPQVREIIKKYNDSSLKPLSDQKTNEYLKTLGKLVGIIELVQTSETKGGIRIDKTIEKYKLITSHTARRSFATNTYIATHDSISIMKITGHKTETSFMKYIKVSSEENANKMLNHPHFQ